MSRPYFNINSMSYTSPVLSMNYTYYKLRSSTPASRTLQIDGFSGSISFTSSHDDVDYSSGRTSDTLTFSVATLGTSSTTTYTPATVTYAFSGTASTTSNVRFTLHGATLSSATASGPTLSTFLSSIVSSFVFSGTNTGFSAAVSSNSIVFTAPTTSGTVYNNLAVTVAGPLGAGGSTLTYSVSGQTFSGGVNTNTAVLSYPALGYSNNIVFNTTGTNL